MALRVVPVFFGYANYSREALSARFYDAAVNVKNYYSKLPRRTSLCDCRQSRAHLYPKIPIAVDGEFVVQLDARHVLHARHLVLRAGCDRDGGTRKCHRRGAGNYSFSQAQQDTDSVWGYGQMITEVLPRTNLTIGFRYTWDSREESKAHTERHAAAKCRHHSGQWRSGDDRGVDADWTFAPTSDLQNLREHVGSRRQARHVPDNGPTFFGCNRTRRLRFRRDALRARCIRPTASTARHNFLVVWQESTPS